MLVDGSLCVQAWRTGCSPAERGRFRQAAPPGTDSPSSALLMFATTSETSPQHPCTPVEGTSRLPHVVECAAGLAGHPLGEAVVEGGEEVLGVEVRLVRGDQQGEVLGHLAVLDGFDADRLY